MLDAVVSPVLLASSAGGGPHHGLLFDISLSIIAATVFAFIAKWLRQPVILGYVVAGIVLGPTQGLAWVSDLEAIETISELGLILLLFMIGLEIDLKKIKQSGKSVIIAGALQFPICVLLGLGTAPLFGFSYGQPGFAPLYLAVACALSSTMIVVKLLYDKFELDTVPGRITLGVLVFQDIWAILFMALQPNLENPAIGQLALSFVNAFAVVATALLLSRYVLPLLFKSIAKLPELMVIGALAWCFSVALFAEMMGLSREMGALIAGVAISTFPYNLDVIAKVISLRDFFITLFFVALGMKIPQPSLGLLGTAAMVAAFVFLSRFIALTPLLRFLKNGNRISVVTPLNLAQMSEFSLVICALGAARGHINEQVLSLVVIVMVVTAVTSTYGIMYSHSIFKGVEPLLRRLGMKDLDESGGEGAAVHHCKPIVFLGLSRSASSLLFELLRRRPQIREDIFVIDFNPLVKEELDRRGIANLYGDIGDPNTLHHANLHDAKVLMCTIPDSILKGTSNARILKNASSLAPEGKVIVTAEFFEQARDLYEQGAAFVFLPRVMGVGELADAVLDALQGDLDRRRENAFADVETREEVLP